MSGPVTDSVVVHAVGVVVDSHHGTGVAEYIESAMQQAIVQAIADGVLLTDSETIKARMLAAMTRARQELGIEEA